MHSLHTPRHQLLAFSKALVYTKTERNCGLSEPNLHGRNERFNSLSITVFLFENTVKHLCKKPRDVYVQTFLAKNPLHLNPQMYTIMYSPPPPMHKHMLLYIDFLMNSKYRCILYAEHCSVTCFKRRFSW